METTATTRNMNPFWGTDSNPTGVQYDDKNIAECNAQTLLQRIREIETELSWYKRELRQFLGLPTHGTTTSTKHIGGRYGDMLNSIVTGATTKLGHKHRLELSAWLLDSCQKTDSEMHAIFSHLDNYDPGITQQQIDSTRRYLKRKKN